MTNWNPAQYLKYGEDRTRAAADLAARIKLEEPEVIVDLGCGPGNSTQILKQRWPKSTINGIDNSPEMIAAATESFPEQTWQLADVTQWSLAGPVHLLYSNAALQWIPGHDVLIPRLFQMVSVGGALAFQIPSGNFATVRMLIHEISHEPAWTQRMQAARNALTMESPAFYYDLLTENASHVDIWETEYNHIMESTDSIVDWMAGTGLRPFLAALDNDEERGDFRKKLLRRVNEAYEIRADGRVLFPFRRTFVIAYG